MNSIIGKSYTYSSSHISTYNNGKKEIKEHATEVYKSMDNKGETDVRVNIMNNNNGKIDKQSKHFIVDQHNKIKYLEPKKKTKYVLKKIN